MKTITQDKQGQTLSSFVIAIITFGVLIIAMSSILSQTTTSYSQPNVNISDEYTNKTSALLNLGNDSYSNIASISKSSSDTSIDSMVKGSYASVKIALGSFRYINDIIWQVQRDLSIPDFVIDSLIAGILIVMSFAVISALFRVRI
jgi:hypothetical protein